MMDKSREPPLELWILLGAIGVILLWSGLDPADRTIWLLEAAPVLVAVPLLWITWRGFPLTPLAYRLIFIHAVILLVGARYTYAEVPLGFWVQDAFDLARNHYDRLGHLAQGFVPAIIAREVFLRTTPLKPGPWLTFLVCCFCLAFSAFYEMIEWWAALIGGEGASAFLGTQGDVWDTQWDMFLALIGAIAAQLIFRKVHDTQIGQRRATFFASRKP